MGWVEVGVQYARCEASRFVMSETPKGFVVKGRGDAVEAVPLRLGGGRQYSSRRGAVLCCRRRRGRRGGCLPWLVDVVARLRGSGEAVSVCGARAGVQTRKAGWKGGWQRRDAMRCGAVRCEG